MRRTIWLLSISLLFFKSSFSQKLIEVTPESEKFSSERLQLIDHLMKSYIDEGKMNGAATLIARNGKIVYYRAFGYDDRENRKPLKRDAIFRIASQSKAITSTAVMILYEEGKFLLDDPVSKYIHSFKNPQVIDKFNAADTTYTTVPAKREVTIRDLLTHTSGIGYAQIGSKEANAIYAKNNITDGIGPGKRLLAEDIQRLGSLPLFNNPGEKFLYGLNTDVLGYLIEVVSGMPLDKFLRTRIFDPLGMNDTYFYLPSAKQNRLVAAYRQDSTGKLVKFPNPFDWNGMMNIDYPKTEGTYFSGGAGLSSTVYDYAIFMQMILNGGVYDGKRILSRNAVRLMTMNQIGDVEYRNNKFGLGFEVVTLKGSSVGALNEGSFNWGGIFSTTYWADPKDKIVALIYKQVIGDPAPDAAKKFQVLVYGAMTD